MNFLNSCRLSIGSNLRFRWDDRFNQEVKHSLNRSIRTFLLAHRFESHFGINHNPNVVVDFVKSSKGGSMTCTHNFLSQHQPVDNKQYNFFLAAEQLKRMVDREPPSFSNVRRHQRSMTIPVSIQPLDEDFKAVGEQFWAVSRDISPLGMGLIFPEPLRFGFVRIGLLNKNASVISRVRHNTSIGETHPMFLVGIEFINGTEFSELTCKPPKQLRPLFN